METDAGLESTHLQVRRPTALQHQQPGRRGGAGDPPRQTDPIEVEVLHSSKRFHLLAINHKLLALYLSTI